MQGDPLDPATMIGAQVSFETEFPSASNTAGGRRGFSTGGERNRPPDEHRRQAMTSSPECRAATTRCGLGV